MKNQILFSILIVIILCVFVSCKKNDPDNITLSIALTDEYDEERIEFGLEDSLIFVFTLSNKTGNEVTYLRPCSEFRNYLNIYRLDDEDIYQYYGRPEYNCTGIAVYETISDDESKQIGRIPWSETYGWPVKNIGMYYIGDTMSLSINGTWEDYHQRIYFEIK